MVEVIKHSALQPGIIEAMSRWETKSKKHMHTTAIKVVFGSKLLVTVGNYPCLVKDRANESVLPVYELRKITLKVSPY